MRMIYEPPFHMFLPGTKTCENGELRWHNLLGM